MPADWVIPTKWSSSLLSFCWLLKPPWCRRQFSLEMVETRRSVGRAPVVMLGVFGTQQTICIFLKHPCRLITWIGSSSGMGLEQHRITTSGIIHDYTILFYRRNRHWTGNPVLNIPMRCSETWWTGARSGALGTVSAWDGCPWYYPLVDEQFATCKITSFLEEKCSSDRNASNLFSLLLKLPQLGKNRSGLLLSDFFGCPYYYPILLSREDDPIIPYPLTVVLIIPWLSLWNHIKPINTNNNQITLPVC